ncbi:MAG TPA: gamma carbonic anhydrase family protein [Candidatus Cloacimonetes bacterium]|nr:gamma carbonic anhydrase family protein [Candidatus Cloacimonadota bacterium]
MILKYKDILPRIGEKTWIAQNATMLGDCEIGNDSSVWFGVVIRGDVNFIRIGDRTNIQDLTMIHVTHAKKDGSDKGFPTIIGNDVTIGHKVMLHGCRIGNACLIGMHATIIDGAEIGDESIVAAGALVTKNKKFPPRSLIVGTPAKVIRSLNEEELKSLYYSAEQYRSYKNDYISYGY